jgi:hypothetical protein
MLEVFGRAVTGDVERPQETGVEGILLAESAGLLADVVQLRKAEEAVNKGRGEGEACRGMRLHGVRTRL